MTAENGRKPLSSRQARFVAEYLTDFNASAAATRAGYSTKDRAAGRKLMSNPVVYAEIRKRCTVIEMRIEMEGDDVRRALVRIATDPREQPAGGPSWEARIKALKELGQLMGLYTQKVHVSGSLTLEQLLLAADRKISEADKTRAEQLLDEMTGGYPPTGTH